jgi:Dolichyl-phosphate-mannose-protein mannosyltransferase
MPETESLANKANGGWWLALIPILLFVGLRLPLLIHQPGGQDEQFFSVPGLTVLREGVPRIPFLPTRRRESFFENADRCLMTLPPAFFYLQAPFFAVMPAGYATARMPSMVGACIMLMIVFLLSKRLGAGAWGAFAACLILALSRPLMFTGILARPDLWCALCGVVVFYILYGGGEWTGKRMAGVGALCGLGALFHPFALVYGIQSAAASLLAPGGLKSRMTRLIWLGCGAVAALALWVPLIVAYPYEFRSQFFSNVLHRAGPGLPSRMLWPIDSIKHHLVVLQEYAGPWQCLLLIVGLFASIVLWRKRMNGNWDYVGRIIWLWSSVYLTAVVTGVHPTKGYWLYPVAILVATLGVAVDSLIVSRSLKLSVILCGLTLLFPGSGLKSTWTYLRYAGSPKYHGARFIESVLDDLPKEGVFMSDLAYAFDIYLSGRKTLLCQDRKTYWGEEDVQYDYLLLTWEGGDAGWAEQYEAQLLRAEGSTDTPQSCYVNIYVPQSAK